VQKAALIVVAILFLSAHAHAASGKIYKVLPHLIDREGKHALSPSLYERDAYQARLRANPQLRRGLRFDVYWKAKDIKTDALRIRVEMRGGKEKEPTTFVAETTVKPHWWRKWSSVTIQGNDYTTFGDLLAWRATLWEGDQILAEQKSFLW
jgi:hypothetical protein